MKPANPSPKLTATSKPFNLTTGSATVSATVPEVPAAPTPSSLGAAPAAGSNDPCKPAGRGKRNEGDDRVPRKRPEPGSPYAPSSAGSGSSALRIVIALLVIGGAGLAGYRLLGPAPSTGLGGGKGASFGRSAAVSIEPIALGAHTVTKLMSTAASGDEYIAWYVPGGGGADAGVCERLLVEVLGKGLRLDGAPLRVGELQVMSADVTLGEKSGRTRAFFTDKDAWILTAVSATPGFGRTHEAERFLSSFANQ